MIEESEITIIKEAVEEFLRNMTMASFSVRVASSSTEVKDVVVLDIEAEDPQILIGQNGQTLFEFSRLLKIILNKKLKKDFYVNVDINDYRKKKVEYLENMAEEIASQAITTKEKKTLPPMPSYERRIIHAKLAGRQDVATQSQGEGEARCVVIAPR